jgi:hypothetical protein
VHEHIPNFYIFIPHTFFLLPTQPPSLDEKWITIFCG